MVADERTATGCAGVRAQQRLVRRGQLAQDCGGSGALSTSALRSACEQLVMPRDPRRSSAATAARTGASLLERREERSKAPVRTTNPGGTAIPARLQLAQAAALAADLLPVGEPDLVEPGDVPARGHRPTRGS